MKLLKLIFKEETKMISDIKALIRYLVSPRPQTLGYPKPVEIKVVEKSKRAIPTIEEAQKRMREGTSFFDSLTQEQKKIALSAPEEAETFGKGYVHIPGAKDTLGHVDTRTWAKEIEEELDAYDNEMKNVLEYLDFLKKYAVLGAMTTGSSIVDMERKADVIREFIIGRM